MKGTFVALNLNKSSVSQCGNLPLNLRTPKLVMNLERLGSLFPQKYSFMRILIRNLFKKNPNFRIEKNKLNSMGFGHCVLTINLGEVLYSLVCFTGKLAAEERSDRVIATKWDACFCLYLGIPNDQEIKKLRQHVTKQENGRFNNNVLVLSRANKSVSLFEYVLNCLANGKQPSKKSIMKTSYLMRTTAVYGNGKFGIADRNLISGNKELIPPFQIEMLTVYLIREFSFFYIEYLAKHKNKKNAITLDLNLKKYLGIGNSTGLGMAPFLVNHPSLLHSWIMAKELILAEVLKFKTLTNFQFQKFIELLTRAKKHVNEWQVEDKLQSRKIKKLNSEVNLLIKKLSTQNLPNSYLLKYFFDQTKNLSIETQEIVASILIELAPNKFDGIEECLANPNEPKLVPSMLISELIEIIRNDYDWVFKLDLRKKSSDTNFWYISQEKLEPRLGNRYEEKGSELEMPFKIPHYVKLLKSLLEKYPNKNDTVASFLLKNPSERFIIRRIQNNARYPYSEIRDNLVDKNCKPIDMLRCKLSFFGASKFDPKSDKWTRVTLFQGAPIASEFFSNKKNYDDWSFATLTN